jgi:hypothetical protein
MGLTPENTTFVSSWNPTSLNGCYNSSSHKKDYVKPKAWMQTKVSYSVCRAERHQNRVCFEVDEPREVFPYGHVECETFAGNSLASFQAIRGLLARSAEALARPFKLP